MELKLIRHVFNDYYTEGYLFLDGKYFCYTLEDKVRHDGVKVYGQTAIPSGEYEVRLEVSPRFQKKLPHILNVPGFDGILIHGGNTANDSLGCVLVAQNKVGPGYIQGSMSQYLVDALSKASDKIKIIIQEAK